MIDYTNFDLYEQDTIKKRLVITTEDGDVIDNSNLHSEEFTLTESLCSEQSLVFGSCEASSVEFKLSGYSKSLKGKKITVVEIINEDEDNPLTLGEYYVNSDKLDTSAQYKSVVAYDKMYDIINADVAEWYSKLQFPMYFNQFRAAFCEHFGLEEEDATLLIDNTRITRNEGLTQLSGKDVLFSICSINGVFGHINRNGKLEYIDLSDRGVYEPTHWKQASAEEFVTKEYTGLEIIDSNSSTDLVVGDDNVNVYKLENNMLVSCFVDDVLKDVATALLNKIKDTSYRPFEIDLQGNPCVEVGDTITFISSAGVEVTSVVLQRELSGIQSLSDRFTTEGTEEVYNKNNSTQAYLQGQIQEILNKSELVYKLGENETAITAFDTKVEVFSINISTKDDCVILFSVSIPYEMNLDGNVYGYTLLDDVTQDDRTICQYSAKGKDILSFTNYFTFLKNQNFKISFAISTEYVESDNRVNSAKIVSFEEFVKDGNYHAPIIDTTIPKLTINAKSAKGVAYSQGIAGEPVWDGTITIADEKISPIPIVTQLIKVNKFTDSVTHKLQIPVKNNVSDTMSKIGISTTNIIVNTFNDDIECNKIIKDESVTAEKLEGKISPLLLDDGVQVKLKTEYEYLSEDVVVDSGVLQSATIITSDKVSIESLVIE